jgi:hypothetical protein
MRESFSLVRVMMFILIVSGEMGRIAALAFARVNMDGHIGKRRHGVEKIVSDLFGNAVTFAGRHLTVNRDVQLGPLTMANPANGNLIDCHNTIRFRSDVLNSPGNLWVYRIHHAIVHIPTRFPNDNQNRNSNAEPHKRIEHGIAQPYADRAA